jgi:hypothetical protein
MSTHAATVSPAAAPVALPTPGSARALFIGIFGLIATGAGLVFSDGKTIAFSYLTAIVFWFAVAIGALFLVMIHHVMDASWSVLVRRQFENWLACVPWLFVLFLPLLASAFFAPGLLWKWTNPAYDLSQIGGHGTVGQDVLWFKKSGLLSTTSLVVSSLLGFGIWSLLANRLRAHSFAQDSDGDVSHTHANRFWTALGLPLTALSMTLCVILWVKALDYHWYSTMYGVWFFANAVRVALSLGVVLSVWLWFRGDYKGILNHNHMYSIGMLMFAFTVFWAYVTFSQYFLIYMANVPEETFWYNLREINQDGGANQWKYVGMFLLFGHFFAPFLALLSYKLKLNKVGMTRVSLFIAFVVLIDIIYNVMPSKKMLDGNAYPFVSGSLIWIATGLIGVGGICVWAYLTSFAKTKLIPIRDPRIVESLTHHE